VLAQLGIRFEHVYLDDAEDARSGALVARWRGAGLAVEEIVTPSGRLIAASSATVLSR
jgi:hypothetical protein